MGTVLHTHTHTHAHASTHTHTCMHTHMHACTHTHTDRHMHALDASPAIAVKPDNDSVPHHILMSKMTQRKNIKPKGMNAYNLLPYSISTNILVLILI